MVKQKIQAHKKQLILGGSVLLLVLGFWLYNRLHFHETTDNAVIQADMVSLSSKVPGFVAEIHVKDNDLVQEGQLLLTLQNEDYKGRFLEAQSAYTSAVENRAQQEQRILQQEATLKSAQAGLTLANQELERTKVLAQDQYAAKKRLETAQASYTQAQETLKETKAALENAISQRKVLDEAIGQAKGALMVAQDNLNATEIKAPFAGQVGNRLAQIGQYARPGGQLMTVVNYQEAYVIGNFKETQLARMKKGQKVTLTVDAYNDMKLEGEVESFSPASGALFSLIPPENATGNFTKIVQRVPVKIRLTKKPEQLEMLRAGLSVLVDVDTH